MSGAEDYSQRDLLQRLISKKNFQKSPLVEEEEEEAEEEIELSLGLSLNGKFGVDPERAKNKIVRASSISSFMIGSDEMGSSLSAAYVTGLTRTCSLPVETEEEWRKRKEMQSLRRMEAKRKRMEKMKNGRVVRGKVDLERNSEENANGEIVTPLGTNGDGVELNGEKKTLKFSSQGSIGSQGSAGSSGVTDFDSVPIQGSNKYNEERSPASGQSTIEQTEQKTDKPSDAVVENPSQQVAPAGTGDRETTNMMADMPSVFTKGEGPKGRGVEGFLYRYKNGEEVKIVCVCHGSFLSPAEFVEHAGGANVANPLRHIVINRSPLL